MRTRSPRIRSYSHLPIERRSNPFAVMLSAAKNPHQATRGFFAALSMTGAITSLRCVRSLARSDEKAHLSFCCGIMGYEQTISHCVYHRLRRFAGRFVVPCHSLYDHRGPGFYYGRADSLADGGGKHLEL